MADKKNTVEVEGIKLTLDENALDDIEVLDMLDEVNEGNPFKIKKLIVALVGEESWNEIKEHLRDDTGRVSATATAQFLVSVIEAVGAKNS